jgi:Methyltransferase domain
MTINSLLREIALAGPEHLDPAYVAGYDRKARFDPAEDVAALRAYGLDANATLIDFGGGTGTFAVAAASVCKRVIAVDVAAPMLDAIRKKAAASGAANIDCVQAGFLGYRHEGPAPDFIYTRNALHHLPDFWKGVALTRLAGLSLGRGSSSSAISSSPSTSRRRKQESPTGFKRAQPIDPRRDGHERSLRATCATSTARSRGCSSR